MAYLSYLKSFNLFNLSLLVYFTKRFSPIKNLHERIHKFSSQLFHESPFIHNFILRTFFFIH